MPISLAYRQQQTKIKDKHITINTKETNRYRDGEDHILHIDKNIILSNRTFMVIGKKKGEKKQCNHNIMDYKKKLSTVGFLFIGQASTVVGSSQVISVLR